MEMSSNSFVPSDELHVAQQSRRQKLRVPPHSVAGDVDGGLPAYFPATVGLPLEVMSYATPAFADVVQPSRFVVPAGSEDSYAFQNGCDFKPFTALPQFSSDYPATSAGIPGPEYQHNHVQNWGGNGGNELALLPSFVNESGLNNNGSNNHGLSLSLSNQPGGGDGGGHEQLKSYESGVVSSGVNPNVHDMVGSSVHVYRNVGPLGPFTGYSSILKNSKFLKPAQLLLDEFLSMAGLRPVIRGSDEVESVSGAPSSSNVAGCPSDLATRSSRGLIDFGNGSGSCESYRPDCHEKKAKLIQMQEEVCKRHKQYHQQMEMVMSAFESVPGLGNATPFISRSLKIISRHFRCIKNVIADQLKHIRKILGEDLSSPTVMAKCESPSLRFEQNFSKVKSGGFGGMGYMGQQNHIWRPQRGLPERAVSILRAWLFDHFLHPYPTDTDKQMLATQTGLSRNQVSNWFINARVRLWKPMVEEIHMLETKGTSSRSEPSSNNSNLSPSFNNRHLASAGCKQAANMMCDKQQFECLGSSSTSIEGCRGETSTEQLFQKRSRMETHQHHHIPTSMDSSLLGFLPYQRRGLEMGGIGAVSLTLGLRHGSESSQQQLQHQFQQQGLHFGSHVIHDFSG